MAAVPFVAMWQKISPLVILMQHSLTENWWYSKDIRTMHSCHLLSFFSFLQGLVEGSKVAAVLASFGKCFGLL